MRQIQHALAEIHDAASMADCRVKPTATLTFNTRGDRYRFERELRRSLDPMLGHLAMEGWPPGEFEIEGIVLKLAVRQVDAQ